MSTRTIIFFTLVNVLNYLDRFLVAAVLPSIISEWQLSDAQGGMLVAAYVPGYVLFSPIFGYLGDRYNRPKLMAFGVFLWSLATLLTGASSSFTLFLLARLLVGVGEASFVAMAPGYLKDRIGNPIKLNSALSLFYSAVPVGTALGYVTGGMIAGSFTWQSAFYLGGIPGLFFALFLLYYPEVEERKISKTSLVISLKEIARTRILWFVIGGYVFNAFALNGLAAWVSEYGQRNLGYTSSETGQIFGLMLLVAGFAGTFFGGRLASILARGKKDPAVSMLFFVGMSGILAAPFCYFGFGSESREFFLSMCFLTELFVFAGIAPINSILVSVCPQSLVTLTQGLAIFLLNILGALPSPIFVGWISDLFSLSLALQSLAIVLFFSGVIWCLGSIKASQVRTKGH